MGPITLFIIFLTISHVSVLQINSVIAVNPSGFSLKIIPSDSKESPLYPGDHLTPEERLQRLVQQSKDRARYIGLQISSFNKTKNSINPDDAIMPVFYEGVASFYVAEIGIGTFPRSPEPFKKNYLIVDSGSETVWIQCAGGSAYFHQSEPLYPKGNSITYKPLRCQDNHPFCEKVRCEYGECKYAATYPKASSIGTLAQERFTVYSDIAGSQTFDIIMGCGFRQIGFERFLGSGSQRGIRDRVTGVLGLGSRPRSLVSQLRITRFSHCLKPYRYDDDRAPTSTYLRFGSDATIARQASKTPLYYPPRPEGRGPYQLNLQGISVNGNPVGVGRSNFEYHPDTGKGGFFIDSGTPFTVMDRRTFNLVAGKVRTYFNYMGIHWNEKHENRGNFKLCYKKPIWGFAYPTMTLHFEDADYLIAKPETLFSITDVDFCLGIVAEDRDSDTNVNILGAMQLAGKRILYDTGERKLSFIAEEC